MGFGKRGATRQHLECLLHFEEVSDKLFTLSTRQKDYRVPAETKRGLKAAAKRHGFSVDFPAFRTDQGACVVVRMAFPAYNQHTPPSKKVHKPTDIVRQLLYQHFQGQFWPNPLVRMPAGVVLQTAPAR